MLTSLIWIFLPGIGAIADGGDDEKARYLGYFGAALGAGMLLGPVLGGVLSLAGNRLWMVETLHTRQSSGAKLQFFPAIDFVMPYFYRTEFGLKPHSIALGQALLPCAGHSLCRNPEIPLTGWQKTLTGVHADPL